MGATLSPVVHGLPGQSRERFAAGVAAGAQPGPRG